MNNDAQIGEAFVTEAGELRVTDDSLFDKSYVWCIGEWEVAVKDFSNMGLELTYPLLGQRLSVKNNFDSLTTKTSVGFDDKAFDGNFVKNELLEFFFVADYFIDSSTGYLMLSKELFWLQLVVCESNSLAFIEWFDIEQVSRVHAENACRKDFHSRRP